MPSAPRRIAKMKTGNAGGSIRNAGTSRKDNGNKPEMIKNAVGMCYVGGQGFEKIKGAVS